MKRRGLLGLYLLYPVIAAQGYWVAVAPEGTRGAGYIALHLALSALMLAAWGLGRDAPAKWILLSGAAARLGLFFAPAFTTHDVRRYLWDGRVALAGLDPYRVSGEAPVAAAFHAGWAVASEHAAYVTLYPPGAIAIFAACASFGPTFAFWAWKAVVTAASLVGLYLAAKMLEERSASRHLALVALSPLLVLETGIGAHLDGLSTLCVVVALLFAGRRRPVIAGLALGFGGLIKFLPLVLLLPLLAAERTRSRVSMGLAAAGVMVAGYCVALLLGWWPIGSLAIFFQKWRFGSPGYSVLELFLAAEHALTLAVFLCVGAIALATRFNPDRPATALASPLLASPMAFPWYLSPLVPAIALAPSATLLGWTLTSPLTYEVLDAFDAKGQWSPQAWPLWVIGLGWAVGLTVDWMRRPRARASTR